MKKTWNDPKLQNLGLCKTCTATPYYFDPRYPECDDPANTGSGYQICTYHGRPCKYFGVLGGGSFLAECSAPSKTESAS